VSNESYMDKSRLKDAFQEILLAQRILVITHIRPDGDAIGSLIGLGLSLQGLNKEIQMVSPDGMPVIFRHLPGSDQVRKKAEDSFDLILALDCSDLSRTGDGLIGKPNPDVNLDHHPTNTNFARYNLVDKSAVATAEILAEYLPKFNFPVTNHVAEALLFGMITDTLGFRTTNMTPKALRISAALMEAGGDLPALYQKGLLKRSFEAARYWGAGLSNLERDGNIIWASLSLEDRRSVGYQGRDDGDLINLLSTIDEADVVIMFVEQEDGFVKVSWRSQPAYDVSQVALSFDGGGHAAAAGANIKGDLRIIQADVITRTKTILGLN
jgi:phosphoesterase RecJ-like protein